MPPTTFNAEPIKNTWGKSVAEGSVVRLTLPSGNECDAERTGMEGMVRAGILAEGDQLTDLVDRKHVRRVRGGKTEDRDEIDARSVMKDPDALGKIVMTVDRAMEHIVKNPTVRRHFVDIENPSEGQSPTRRIPDDKREDGVVYTDQIPLEDKMFLFQWACGGAPDVARFREQSQAAVAAVADGKGIRHKAKRHSRDKG